MSKKSGLANKSKKGGTGIKITENLMGLIIESTSTIRFK